MELQKKQIIGSLISINRLEIKNTELRWYLDSPLEESLLYLGNTVTVRGWVLTSDSQIHPHIYLYIKTKLFTYCYPLNENRKDVVEAILKSPDNNHPMLLCGFNYEVSAEEICDDFQIGFEIKGEASIFANIISRTI